MFIDTHAHIINKYYDNIAEEVEKSKEKKVNIIINIGTCDSEFDEVISLSEKYKCFYNVVGYYPSMIEKIGNLQYLEKCIKNKKNIAIGEIGLDYTTCDHKEKQLVLFEEQIKLAIKYNKPIVVHCRDAIKDTYDLLNKYNCAKLRGVIHCYSGSFEMAKLFNEIGFYLGIGGVYTFKNNVKGIEVLKNIPLEYFVLETDAPYLTPEPFRGKKNSSSYIPDIANKIASIKGISVEDVMIATTNNAKSLFDFNQIDNLS